MNVVGSVVAAAERGAVIDNGLIDFRPVDLRGSLRRGTESNLIVFLVDASGSMAARDRLSAVTGAVLAMLQDAYQRRDKVAVISVRGQEPELLLPPTGSIDVAVRRLRDTQTGGRTPLGEGLHMADELIQREFHRHPQRRAILVVLSDGRATGSSGLAGAQQAAVAIQRRGLAGSVVVDCERQGRIRLGLAQELARNLGGMCVQIDDLHAESLRSTIEAL